MATSVLVVDPDEAIRDLFVDILREEGCEVATARSLGEAAQRLSRSRFDLVVTEAFGQNDLFDFDPAFLETLREQSREVPIILSSTYPSTDSLRAGDYGLAEIVPKPFEIDQLLRKINRALGRERVVGDRPR